MQLPTVPYACGSIQRACSLWRRTHKVLRRGRRHHACATRYALRAPHLASPDPDPMHQACLRTTCAHPERTAAACCVQGATWLISAACSTAASMVPTPISSALSS
jgi:hypothetical protein